MSKSETIDGTFHMHARWKSLNYYDSVSANVKSLESPNKSRRKVV